MLTRDTIRYGVSFAANVLQGSRPRVLYLEVTKRCNAFCSFCPYWQDHRREELADYSPIVTKFKPFCVTFTGGEPLLRRDLPKLIRQVTSLPRRPYTAVLTNGWLLTPARAQTLRDAGCEQVSLSIDYIGEKHDEQRGLPGLYRRIEERIPALQRIGFDRIVVNVVIMDSNLDQLVPLALQTARWGVAISYSSYSTLKTDSAGELVAREQATKLKRIVEEIKHIKRERRHVISSDFYLDGVVAYFENGGHLGDHCRAAGKKLFHIDPWGYVKICPEFPPFAHWSALPEQSPEPHHCTRCWYGCRGENEAPMTLARIRDIVRPVQVTRAS